MAIKTIINDIQGSPSEELGLLTRQQKQRTRRCDRIWLVLAPCVLIAVGMVILLLRTLFRPPLPYIRVAFVGNDQMIYNDLPRLVQSLAPRLVRQDSCLHADASLSSILETGNGMAYIFNTYNAYDRKHKDYDMGACTVPQLLLASDAALDAQVQEGAAYLRPDGSNPCLESSGYWRRLQTHKPPVWDFVVLNDAPVERHDDLQESLRVLQDVYLPWFQQTATTPLFLVTHAVRADDHDLKSIASTTLKAHQQYQSYVDLLAQYLPIEHTPLIIPLGIAFLVVYEEDHHLWKRLFDSDGVHCSPAGTLLQSLVTCITMAHTLPNYSLVVSDDTSVLWRNARILQQSSHAPKRFPTIKEAAYLYDVADRVARQQYRPQSFGS